MEDDVTKDEYEHMLKLAPYLGGLANSPRGVVNLVEIYDNGNVACMTYLGSRRIVKEFHILSVTGEKLPTLEDGG